MADLTITTGAFRIVRDDPEDERTYDAAAAYVPALGDLVAISGDNEVDQCDATDANSLVEPVGVVTNVQAVRTAAGAAGYRLSVARRAGAIESVDPTTTGVTGKVIGIAQNATQIDFTLPSL